MKYWNPKKSSGPRKMEMVRILTIKGKPTGVVTVIMENHPFMYQDSYWVRLKNGELIKELTINEITGK